MIDKFSSVKQAKYYRDSSIIKPTDTDLGQVYKKSQSGTRLGTIKDSKLTQALSRKNRQNHTHILGSTGTGKSKIIELLIRQDIQDKKCGLCLLDPHGSLYDEILLYASHYYPRLADRIVLFNPANDTETVLGFNPMSMNTGSIDYLLESLISACLKAWGQDNTDNTPRITKWLENIFYTIIVNDLTLLETVPLIRADKDNPQRNIMIQNVNSDVIQGKRI